MRKTSAGWAVLPASFGLDNLREVGALEQQELVLINPFHSERKHLFTSSIPGLGNAAWRLTS